MAIRVGSSSVSCVSSPISSAFWARSLPVRWLRVSNGCLRVRSDAHQLTAANAKVKSPYILHEVGKLKRTLGVARSTHFAVPGDEPQTDELESDVSELEDILPDSNDSLSSSSSYIQLEGSDGRPGFVSFYNRPYRRDNDVLTFETKKNQNNWVWFLGPTVLVTSFILPSLYLRRILSTIFEDSLLTDFLILFFTEALFYCGVAIFVLVINHMKRSKEIDSANAQQRTSSLFGQRISSVATLVLSLIIPMVTMGFVWPWTGPAASAALAPYLVGIVVQFAFEQYARHKRSPSLAVIPIIFQVYRLHQLNRAAQLVTALSFTVRGAEMTSHNLAINSSLGTLLNVLQLLGVICIWSLSSFLIRFFPSITD